LYPKDRQESEVVNDEKPEVWGGLTDKYLPDLTTGRQEWGGSFDEIGSFYRFFFSHILYLISGHRISASTAAANRGLTWRHGWKPVSSRDASGGPTRGEGMRRRGVAVGVAVASRARIVKERDVDYVIIYARSRAFRNYIDAGNTKMALRNWA